MKKKIILHLGVHKTGSSYLQHALKNYQQEYNDIAYFSVHSKHRETHLTFRKKFNLLRNALLTNGVSDALQATQTKAFLDAKKYICQEIEKTQQKLIVISDENLLGVPMGQIMPGGSYMEYDFYPQRKNIALCLKEIFSPYDLQVILYSRQKIKLIESLYSNALKNLSFSRSLNKFAQEMRINDIDFRLLENDLSKAFGTTISTLAYETLKKDSSKFAEKFFKATTINIPNECWPKKSVNSRLADRHVKIATGLAKQQVTPELQAKFRKYLKAYPTNPSDTFTLTTLP